MLWRQDCENIFASLANKGLLLKEKLAPEEKDLALKARPHFKRGLVYWKVTRCHKLVAIWNLLCVSIAFYELKSFLPREFTMARMKLPPFHEGLFLNASVPRCLKFRVMTRSFYPCKFELCWKPFFCFFCSAWSAIKSQTKPKKLRKKCIEGRKPLSKKDVSFERNHFLILIVIFPFWIKFLGISSDLNSTAVRKCLVYRVRRIFLQVWTVIEALFPVRILQCQKKVMKKTE